MESSASSACVEKIVRVVGVEEAERVTSEGMRRAGLSELDSADARHRFGVELIRMGGLLAGVGNAIAVEAILECDQAPGESGVRTKVASGQPLDASAEPDGRLTAPSLPGRENVA